MVRAGGAPQPWRDVPRGFGGLRGSSAGSDQGQGVHRLIPEKIGKERVRG